MFGYIRVYKEKLSIQDYNAYKMIYCSLCKTLGRRYSILKRISLSYDATFLATVLYSCMNKEFNLYEARCFGLIGKKRQFITENELLILVADISLLFTLFTMKDDYIDKDYGKFFVKSIVLSKVKDTLQEKYPDIYDLAECKYNKLVKAEQNFLNLQKNFDNRILNYGFKEKLSDEFLLNQARSKCISANADFISETLRKFMFCNSILQLSWNSEIKSNYLDFVNLLSEAFKLLATWIYYADALDDFFTDTKKQKFNLYSMRDISDNFWDEADQNFMILEQKLVKTFASIPVNEYGKIIANILHYGLPIRRTFIYNKFKKYYNLD